MYFAAKEKKVCVCACVCVRVCVFYKKKLWKNKVEIEREMNTQEI